MAVEEVSVPAKIHDIDPKKTPQKTDEIYWERRNREARARAEFIETQKLIDSMENPPSQPAPPITIRGSVNLGDIDFQAQAREAAAKEERQAELRALEAKEMRTRNDELAERNKQLEIGTLKEQISQQMDQLRQVVSAGLQKPKNFFEQYEEIMGMVNKLGALNPKEGNSDPKFQLEILKMNAQIAKDDREFKQQMRNDDRKWNLEMEKVAQERVADERKIQAERERNALFANSFKGIGAAVAAGLLETGKGAIPSDSGITQQPLPTTSRPKRIEADEGAAGEIKCPNCGTGIGVGPTSTQATCASCGLTLEVRRRPAKASQPEPEEKDGDDSGARL